MKKLLSRLRRNQSSDTDGRFNIKPEPEPITRPEQLEPEPEFQTRDELGQPVAESRRMRNAVIFLAAVIALAAIFVWAAHVKAAEIITNVETTTIDLETGLPILLARSRPRDGRTIDERVGATGLPR